MNHRIKSPKIQTTYKKPNLNFSNQLCIFLSQSKHQKQQKLQDINQYMVEQFIHLFEICNINRYMDYTKQFIDQIRNLILRLQLIQKKQFELLDERDEYMYLIVQGQVQKIKRQRPQAGKRITRFNLTSFNFGNYGSNTLINSFNTRSSHQAFCNIQLKQFQKSVILNRNSRMSMVSGSLLNELIASPRKRMRTQQKQFKGQQRPHQFYRTFSQQPTYHESPFKLSKPSKFKQQIQQQSQSPSKNSSQQQQDEQQEQWGRINKVQLLQPLQNQVYRCLTPVKYIKLLKWSYDQLVQYVYKYQNDMLINFLAKTLQVTEGEIRSFQIYNKTNYKYYQERQSRHSNQYIPLDKDSIYIIRQGIVQLKYTCPFPTKKKSSSDQIYSLSNNKSHSNNLASYINPTEKNYKKIILNQGAIIYPQLQTNQIFVQALSTVVFIELNPKLIQQMKIQLSNKKWWGKKFCIKYQKVKQERAMYMKDEQVIEIEKRYQLNVKNVIIQTKNRRLHTAKAENTRFRVQNKQEEEQNRKILQQTKIPGLFSNDNQQKKNFTVQQCKQFISLLPYQIMVKSKQKISSKLKEKSKHKHVAQKVFNYLKKNQKPNSSAQYNNKMLQLKLKNIAAKQIKVNDLNLVYADINNNAKKKQLHQSIKSNWFKEQNDNSNHSTNSKFEIKMFKKDSRTSEENGQMGSNQKIISHKVIPQIVNLNRRFQTAKKKFSMNTLQSTEYDEKKVTFALNNLNNLDDSSQEEYLCNDDTGLIKKFVQNSHNYQKEIAFLINSSQRQDKSQTRKKKKIKTCKTQQGNIMLSHNLINDILKRVNKGVKIPLNKIKQNISRFQTKNDQKYNQTQKDNQSKQCSSRIQQKVSQNNNSSLFNKVFSIMGRKTKQNLLTEYINSQDTQFKNQRLNQQFVNFEEKKKQNKPLSYTNYSSCKSQSFKLLNSPHSRLNTPSSHHRKIPKSAKFNNQAIVSSQFERKMQRPMTSCGQSISRTQCKSLMFNQWIETEASRTNNEQRNSECIKPVYDFCNRNNVSGDRKIRRQLQNGKIMKKSVKYYNNNIKSQSFKYSNVPRSLFKE